MLLDLDKDLQKRSMVMGNNWGSGSHKEWIVCSKIYPFWANDSLLQIARSFDSLFYVVYVFRDINGVVQST